MRIRDFVKQMVAVWGFVSLLFMQVAVVPVQRVFGQSDSEGAATTIYDNGGLATGSVSANGVSAPAGTQWSEDQADFGFTTQANTVAGASCSVTTTVFRCADDFNVPVGQTWTINQVVVFAYQTGFAGTTSPITAATLQIWRGRPGDAGSTIVFGDTTTNRLATSTNSNLFRIFNTVVGAGAQPPTPPATNRIVWQNNINVSPAAVLTAGNYWIDWNTQIGTTTAHFAPAATILGTRTVPGWNARQFTTAGWIDSLDNGQAPTGQPVPYSARQDFPFKLIGSVSGAPAVPRSRTLDFDGDNKSDLVVARAANSASQATWLINNSAGTTAGVAWGLGTGLAGGDIPTPADFDGDGKTDIAVWRSGAPGAAGFFVLKSNGNVFDFDPFGQAGDDPTVVGDYDGDAKADLAVFRTGATAHWWYQRSTVGGSGCTAPSACNDLSFGTTGDRPYPGDFDGDGRYDLAIIRNSGGAALHFQDLSTDPDRVIPFGAFTDKFLTGDFDADGRTDLAAVRTNGTVFDWYVMHSGNGQLFSFTYGLAASDFVVPGDYDGDKKTDYAVWRSGPQPNYFWKKTATPPVLAYWGAPTDVPVGIFVNVH